MNIAYCEDEKIQLEYMEQLIRKWADEGNDTVTYFGYGSAKELLFEHPDSFPFDLLLLDIDMDGMDGMDGMNGMDGMTGGTDVPEDMQTADAPVEG